MEQQKTTIYFPEKVTILATYWYYGSEAEPYSRKILLCQHYRKAKPFFVYIVEKEYNAGYNKKLDRKFKKEFSYTIDSNGNYAIVKK